MLSFISSASLKYDFMLFCVDEHCQTCYSTYPQMEIFVSKAEATKMIILIPQLFQCSAVQTNRLSTHLLSQSCYHFDCTTLSTAHVSHSMRSELKKSKSQHTSQSYEASHKAEKIPSPSYMLARCGLSTAEVECLAVPSAPLCWVVISCWRVTIRIYVVLWSGLNSAQG